MTNIIITGSKGRMGGRIAKLARTMKDLSIAAEIDFGDSLEQAAPKGDVIIDFTVAAAAPQNAGIAARFKKPIVIGTTGLKEEELAKIREASKIIPIVMAPNMSVGVNVMWKLIEIAAATLGRKYSVDIVETHHIHKLDKPSGTAKKILDIVLEKSGRSLNRDVFFYEEETSLPPANDNLEVSVRSIRRGEVVGDHVVHFTSPDETLSITHSAANRDVFAEGAITAAKWIVGKPAGLYGMDDVLGLK